MSRNVISEKIYLTTLFIWILFYSLFITTYFVQFPIIVSLYKPLLYVTLLVLSIKELLELSETTNYLRYRPGKLLLILLFIGIMLLRARNRDGLLDVNIMMLVLSARNIDLKKILGVFSLSTFLTLLITVIASKNSYISNMIMNGDNGYRYSLGFRYVSFASQRLFFGLCSYLMYRDKKISYIELFILLLSIFYIYQQTGTSSPFYLSLLIILYVFLSVKVFNKDLITDNKVPSFLAKYSYILALLVILYFCFYSSGELYQLVDKFTHNRLRLSVDGFRNFGVSLLGQKISFTTLDIFGNFTSNYNYIDSYVVQSLVIDGLLYSVFMIYSVTKILSEFILVKKDVFVACLSVMVLHGMFDPQLFVLYYSPFILFLSTLFATRRAQV